MERETGKKGGEGEREGEIKREGGEGGRGRGREGGGEGEGEGGFQQSPSSEDFVVWDGCFVFNPRVSSFGVCVGVNDGAESRTFTGGPPRSFLRDFLRRPGMTRPAGMLRAYACLQRGLGCSPALDAVELAATVNAASQGNLYGSLPALDAVELARPRKAASSAPWRSLVPPIEARQSRLPGPCAQGQAILRLSRTPTGCLFT